MKWTYRAKPSSADTPRRRRRLPSAARMALRAGWWCILLCVGFWAGRQQTAAQNPDTAFAALPACSSSEAISGSSSSSPSADSSPADPEPLVEGEVLSVPLLSQQQLGMPTGCELVSAGMLLEYYGCDLTLYQWMDNCVEFSTPWLQDGRMVNLSPWEAFIGSPWESSGYGCFAPVIRDALALALPDTICMEETSEGPSWLTPEGETFTRTNNEHCIVLVGSDSDNYIFNDPYQAGGQVSYPRQLAESRYEEMGRQAVAVTG